MDAQTRDGQTLHGKGTLGLGGVQWGEPALSSRQKLPQGRLAMTTPFLCCRVKPTQKPQQAPLFRQVRGL